MFGKADWFAPGPRGWRWMPVRWAGWIYWLLWLSALAGPAVILLARGQSAQMAIWLVVLAGMLIADLVSMLRERKPAVVEEPAGKPSSASHRLTTRNFDLERRE